MATSQGACNFHTHTHVGKHSPTDGHTTQLARDDSSERHKVSDKNDRGIGKATLKINFILFLSTDTATRVPLHCLHKAYLVLGLSQTFV